MTYERTPDGAIRREVDIEGVEQKLILRAQNVRKERTGVHATITIGFGSTILDEDTFNIGRREDRNRLSNAAVKNPMLDRRVAENQHSANAAGKESALRDSAPAGDAGRYTLVSPADHRKAPRRASVTSRASARRFLSLEGENHG